MKKQTIKIDGRTYPCYPTMGAALIFKTETGRDLETLSGSADFVIYLWACATSACRREGRAFGLSLEEFADSLTPAELTALATDLAPEATAAPEADEKND